jgi:TolA-binding protein
MNATTRILAAGLVAFAIGCAEETRTVESVPGVDTTPGATAGSPQTEIPPTYANGTDATTPNGAPALTSPAQTVTAAKVAQETRQALETTGQFVAQGTEEFATEVRAQLANIDSRVEQLEEQANTLTADARAEWQEHQQQIQEKRDALEAKLSELSAASDDAAADLREGVQTAWDEFEAAVKSAADQFDQGGAGETAPDAAEQPAAPGTNASPRDSQVITPGSTGSGNN